MIVLIAWNQAEDKPEEFPRLCPGCHAEGVIGHGWRWRRADDGAHQSIHIRRGLCKQCGRTITMLPVWLAYLLQRNWWRSPLSRRKAPLAADLRLKVPPRVIEPLSREQVSRFWESFRTARDIAIVGLLLFNGLRSCEVLALELEDLLLSEGQIRVSGKGAKSA